MVYSSTVLSRCAAGNLGFCNCAAFCLRFDLHRLSYGVDAAAVAAGVVAVQSTSLDSQRHRSTGIINIEPNAAAVTGCRVFGNLCRCDLKCPYASIDAAARSAGNSITVHIGAAYVKLGAIHIPALIDTAAVGLGYVVGYRGADRFTVVVGLCLAGPDIHGLGEGIDTTAAGAGGISVDRTAIDGQNLLCAIGIIICVEPHAAAIAGGDVSGNTGIRDSQRLIAVSIQTATLAGADIVGDHCTIDRYRSAVGKDAAAVLCAIFRLIARDRGICDRQRSVVRIFIMVNAAAFII